MAQQREGEICAEWLVVRPTTGEISVSGDELGGPKTVIVVSMILLLYEEPWKESMVLGSGVHISLVK